MKYANWVIKIFSLSSHLIPFYIIYLSLAPIIKWYFSKIPVLGVDFYNSVSHATYLAKNGLIPINAFGDIWFAGYPLYRVFISFHWLAMVPFISEFGQVRGVQTYVIFSLFLLCVSCYLLYFHLTKSRVFALICAFLVLYSVNIYGAFTWGGSIPFFATQSFLPLALLFADKYVVSNNMRWFWACVLVSGFGFMFHPLPIFAFVLPTVSILIFFGMKPSSTKLIGNIFGRVKMVFIFVIASLLVALPASYERLFFTLGSLLRNGPLAFLAFVRPAATDVSQGASLGGEATQGTVDIANFYQGLIKLLYTDTNQLLFALAGIGAVLFLITLVLMRKKSVFLRVLPYFLIAAYSTLHPFLNAYGFVFIPQGWYRAFWQFPIALGALAAVLWGVFYVFVREKTSFGNKKYSFFAENISFGLLGMVFLVVGYLFYSQKSSDLIAVLDTKSEISSAHPQALSIKTSQGEIDEIKSKLLPGFINAQDKNKRVYISDALVNIWWPSFYEIPLARGYVDPPLATSQRGGIFWLDIAVGNDSLVRDFKVPENMAYNNALFLMDWNGIYYYEGGRFGISSNVPPSSYLLKNNVFEKEATTEAKGALIKWQTPSGKPELHMEIPQYLKFFKVRDEFTSPILYASNASPILVFSDDSGYENVMRGFASENLNSRYVVPVNAGKYIDDVGDSEFAKFDAVILQNYSYHNKGKAFNLLLRFLEKGGKVFIDTGAESKESEAEKLPEILPFSSTGRKGLGKEWQTETKDDPILESVNIKNFGPLDFNGDEWKISYPTGDLEGDAKAIISQAGKPVLVRQKVKSGEVIWSGLNLLYHVNQFKIEDEAKLFANIVRSLVPIQKTNPIQGDAKWLSSEKVTLKTQNGARGIIFKEEFYPGWNVNVKGDGIKGASLYKVGPTFPGFMYAAISGDRSKPFTAEFNYRGAFEAYLYYFISIVLTLILLDIALFGGYVFVKRFNFVKKATDQKMSTWWEKEDE